MIGMKYILMLEKITIVECAKRMGVVTSLVSSWTNGKKKIPDARITVTAYKRIQHPVPKAEDILDDVITTIEESDNCPAENNYRSNKKLLEAAEAFKKAIEEEIDPWYYPAFDVLCYLNKPNKIGE